MTNSSIQPNPTIDPLVSCIMPTANRPHFAVHAIRHFLRQDYSSRELIILDDGEQSLAGLIPADERIRYIRQDARQTIGAKRNLGCELARGEIILHWDDDDWMAAWRISYQVKELLRRPAQTLTGLSRLLFYDPCGDRAWEYVYPEGGLPWVAGATFCYFRSFWETRRFRDMNEGEDTTFVWELKDANVARLPDQSFYVATVHPGNTSRKQIEGGGWRPLPSQEVHQLLDDAGREFYDQFSKNLRQTG